jgi:hypothetical protein
MVFLKRMQIGDEKKQPRRQTLCRESAAEADDYYFLVM